MERSTSFAAVALALGIAGSNTGHASTVLNVVPGSGSLLDVGSLCLTTSTLCPGNSSDLNLAQPFAGLAGDFIYTPLTAASGTMSFTLTLSSNATFGSQIMLAGSSFTVSNVDVTESVSGGVESITQTSQTTGAIVSTAHVTFASGLQAIQNTPFVSNLNCLFAASGGECGVSLGGSVASGLQFGPDPSNGGGSYNAALTFDANITPVPLPAGIWLMLSGMGFLIGKRRRDTLQRQS